MTLSTEHEETNRTLALLIEPVAGALANAVRNVGSMTWRREDLQRGFEPDSSFYIQNEEQVRARVQLASSIDPLPDSVIGIDVSRSSLDKLAIYASMGVPEMGRFDDGHLAIGDLSRPRPNWMWAVLDWARSQRTPDETAR